MWQADPSTRLIVNAASAWTEGNEKPDHLHPELFTFELMDQSMNRAKMAAIVNGVGELRSVTVTVGPDALYGTALTALGRQLPKLVDHAAARVLEVGLDPNALSGVVGMGHDVGRRTTLTDKFLREVAEVYRANDGIVEAVRRHFNLSQRTAYRYVTAAKDRGFITEED